MKIKNLANEVAAELEVAYVLKFFGLLLCSIAVAVANWYISRLMYVASVENVMLGHFLEGVMFFAPVVTSLLIIYAYIFFGVDLFRAKNISSNGDGLMRSMYVLLFHLGRITVTLLVSLALYFIIEKKGDSIIAEPKMYIMFGLGLVFLMIIHQIVKRTTRF